MRLPRIWKRCASAFARNCDSSQRLSPSWRGAGSRRAGHAFGRVGRPCRGRCKYVHVSSVAASMRLTPLHGLPTLPSTVSCGRPPRKKEKKSRSGSRAALARAEPSVGSALQKAANQAAFAFDLLFLFRGWQTAEIVRGRSGWVRGGVRGMDAAAKPYLIGIWHRRCREPAWAAV